MYRAIIRLILFGVLVVLGGCGGSDANHSLEKLYENKRKWESLNAGDYQFKHDIACHCPMDMPKNVLVSNGEVLSVTAVESGAAIRLEDSPLIASIDALFELIALEESRADSLNVEYHPQFGYPTLISFDRNSQQMHDEFTIRISDVQFAEDLVCTTEVRPGLSLRLIDQVSKQAINCDATVTAQQGDFIESFSNNDARCEDDAAIDILFSTLGFFQVSIDKPGYQNVQIDDVGVGQSLCNLVTHKLSIELVAE